MKLIDALNWRYATKRMNGEKVPAEKLDAILEATRLSASSMGLQPYTILVVENEAVKKRLYEVLGGKAPLIDWITSLCCKPACPNVESGET